MSDISAEPERKCLVCGDKAIGVNFNVITCESCKVLFRRNALNYERFKCQFNNDCKIDIFRRRFCKKCRLKKCFAVGMKKEWILTEEERRVRKKKIEENRNKRKASNSLCDSTSSESSSSQILSDNSSDQLYAQNIQFESYVKFDDISDSAYRKAVELEFTVNPMTRPLDDCDCNFNEVESNRLTELFSATNVMLKPNLQRITSEFQMNVIRAYNTNPNITAEDVSRVMAIYLEKTVDQTVQMSRLLSAFNSLCVNDQIALVKYGCIEICSIRSILVFNYEHEYWNLALDNENSVIVTLDLLKRFKRNTYINHKNFQQKMLQEGWNSDLVIIDLLTAIILFNPERPLLNHSDLVKLQQHIYMYLLQRHLLLRYRSESEAKSKFLRLMNCLTELQILNEKIAMNWLEADPQRCMPLMSEICDRNNT